MKARVENVDLLHVASELYALVPAEFTAARNARAKDVASGQRELAGEIRALPKPSAAAWALNRLVHDDHQAAEDFDELGRKLRQAQERADREQLDSLVRERRVLIKRTSSAAQQRAAEHGVALSASAIAEVEQSLQAALADATGHAAAFSGRLIRSIRSDGLEPVDLDGAVGGPEFARKISGGGGSSKSATRSTKAHDARVAKARKAVETADAALAEVREQQATVEHDHDDLDAAVTALQEQFDQLEKRGKELDSRSAAVARALGKADEDVRRARAEAARADQAR